MQNLIDDKFCEMFVPLKSRMKNMTKSRKTKVPSCTGKALFLKDGQIYSVTIKGDAVVNCSEYKRKNKVNLTADDYKLFRIISYDFNIENSALKQGMAKIAMSFAMYKNIKPEILRRCFTTQSNENGDLTHLNFICPIVVFLPCNELDRYMELHSRIDLFHSLILFSHRNLLVCYVDLFNTFQYYVILSETWNNEPVYESHCQMLIKFDRRMPDLHISRMKHVLLE